MKRSRNTPDQPDDDGSDEENVVILGEAFIDDLKTLISEFESGEHGKFVIAQGRGSRETRVYFADAEAPMVGSSGLSTGARIRRGWRIFYDRPREELDVKLVRYRS